MGMPACLPGGSLSPLFLSLFHSHPTTIKRITGEKQQAPSVFHSFPPTVTCCNEPPVSLRETEPAPSYRRLADQTLSSVCRYGEAVSPVGCGCPGCRADTMGAEVFLTFPFLPCQPSAGFSTNIPERCLLLPAALWKPFTGVNLLPFTLSLPLR